VDVVGFWITSSTKLFHSPHEGHFPRYFAACVPQFWQKNAVLILLILQSDCYLHPMQTSAIPEKK
jgi:hypothetical protein